MQAAPSHPRVGSDPGLGEHEPGTSHHDLLRAFVDAPTLARIDAALEDGDWHTHEFGDSVWIERSRSQPRWNLNTATLASRFGQVRTALPASMPKASRIARPSLRARTSKSA